MAFPFLNFPAEIRNRVYAHLLCPEPLGKLTELERRHRPVQITHLFHTAILLTCRQVHHEARATMIKGNEFVGISLRGIPVARILTKLHVHIVVLATRILTWSVARDFRGAVMMYQVLNQGTLDEEGQREYNTCDILIRGRDLDALARDLSDPAVSGHEVATAEHTIDMLDPFMKNADPSYDTLAAQKRLLQPFCDHYRGFLNVKITGTVDRALAASAVEEMQSDAVPDADEFVASLVQLKDEGNVLFHAGDYFEAGEKWSTATALLRRMAVRRNWPRVQSLYGRGVLDKMAELLFTLYSNQAQAILSDMRGYDLDDEMEMDDARWRVDGNCRAAETVSNVLGTWWTPSPRQRAKLLYKAAQAARLTGDLLEAQSLIDEAKALQPGDPDIRRDADEISRLSTLLLNHLN
ncbi:hypothetical protein M406DRAFT_329622 [Cryphonectria parasitica EP155]|uniref:F-box domain-containing protein n=1 Tax=Cryphonectria parasitica (strain ATCC 38755 / EP155) TaxID=660469 RepID=A0A9P4Y409_CRYP1|nr:uncharacterized protein M406DRAFT_329622 [Cryphonectria parasitica EP155]KAF3765750.1 hypothetical protein M406DRAFT_329622 [Cryphonectria parasitica EP155]